MKKALKLAGWLLIVHAAVAASACSGVADEVTNTVDCHGVCKRYADCFNADYDVEGCTDKCEDGADASEERQRRLKRCSDCIDGQSCASAFACADECIGIVP